MAGIMDITGDETTTEDTDREKVFTMKTRLHGTSNSLTNMTGPMDISGEHHCHRHHRTLDTVEDTITMWGDMCIVNSNLIIG